MLESVVVTVARQFQRQLLAREARQMAEMAGRWVSVQDALEANITKLVKEFAALRARGIEPTAGQLSRMTRYHDLLMQTRQEVSRYVDNYAAGLIAGEQAAMLDLGADHAGRLLATTGLRTSFNRLPVPAVQSMVGFTADGTPLRDLLMKGWPDAVDGLTKALVDGTALGWNPRKTARAMRQGVDSGLDRMLTIARTEQLRAYRTSTQESYRESGVVAGYRRLAAKQLRTCMACLVLDGTFYRLEEEFGDHVNGRCLAPGAVVNGPPVHAFVSRRYDGEIVSIRTATGKFLAVTPNHPILTDRGWVGAGFLQKGDNVVCHSGHEGTAATMRPDEYQVPTLIEEVPTALRMNDFAGVPGSAEDFHGDGKGGEVYVVRANGLLRNRGDAAFEEPIGQQIFGGGGMADSGLSGLSRFAAMLKGEFAAAAPFLGDGDAAAMLFDGSLCGEQSVCCGLIAERYSEKFQPQPDHAARDAESLSQAVFGLAGQVASGNLGCRQWRLGSAGSPTLGTPENGTGGLVAEEAAGLEGIRETLFGGMEPGSSTLGALAGNISLDRVIEVGRRSFSGHVYNLHTSAGWYIARSVAQSMEDANCGGLVVHNCALVPVVMGREDQPTRTEDGKAWLEKQSDENQQAIMGKARWQVWKDGRLGLDDLVTITHSATWGASPGVRPLMDLIQQ